MSPRYRGRPRVVLEAVCHRHPDEILIRPEMDIPSGDFVRRGRNSGLNQALSAEGQRRLEVGRCPHCKLHPQWNREKVRELLAALPEGVWRVTDVEMDRLIRDPRRAVAYLQARDATVRGTKPGFGG